MASDSVDDRYDMFCTYLASGRNAAKSSEIYQHTYPDRRQPHISQFSKVARNVYKNKNFSDAKRQREAEETSVINVLASVEASNRQSSREMAYNAGTSQSTAIRVLKKHNYKPYHKRSVHTLQQENDPNGRSEFCHWFLTESENCENFPRSILWTDESKFTNCGIYNRHNEVLWCQENPYDFQEVRPQVKFGFNVWCGLTNDKVIGPIIYHDHLNSERYLNLLQNDLQVALDDLPLNVLQNIRWFQHDGAPPHNARIISNYLNNQFLERWIGNNGPVLWPARSPDLTPLDFFFWGHVKDMVYNTRYNTIGQLEEAVRETIRSIQPRHILNAVNSVRHRCNSCLLNNGRHFEHFL